MSASRPVSSRPLRGLALAAAVVLGGLAPACNQEEPTTAPNSEVDNQNLIGGFAANDMRLDGSGSMVVVYPFGYTDLLCSAALLTPESVLTAKHCAEAIAFAYGFGAKIGYAIGPNSAYPRQVVEVVAFETAPGDFGGFVGYGRDVAVLHLDHPLTGAPTVDVAALGDGDVGNPFAAIGYGVQDNSFSYGTRRLGKQTLKGREGKIFEIMFGSFEAFYDWFLTGEVDPNQFLTPARSGPAPGRPASPGAAAAPRPGPSARSRGARPPDLRHLPAGEGLRSGHRWHPGRRPALLRRLGQLAHPQGGRPVRLLRCGLGRHRIARPDLRHGHGVRDLRARDAGLHRAGQAVGRPLRRHGHHRPL